MGNGQLVMDGSPLCKGDEVYDPCNGWGEVSAIDEDKIKVYFRKLDSFIYYKFETISGVYRKLYWGIPEYIPPPKPKKKIIVCDWFVELENGSIIRINASPDYRQNVMWYVKTAQKIDGTEKEIEI